MGRNFRNVPLMRFSVVLPFVHFLLALGLFEWGIRIPWPKGSDTLITPTPIIISTGINAPAIVFRLIALPFRDRWRHVVFGLNLDDLFFFWES